MFKVNVISYLICLLLSIVSLIWLIPVYSPPDVGSGIAPDFFPNVISCVMLIASGIGLVKTLINGEGKGIKSPVTIQIVLKFIPFIAVIGLSFPLMRLIGFIPGGIIVMLAFQFLLGERRIVHMAAMAVGIVLLYYVVFWYGMKIMLP